MFERARWLLLGVALLASCLSGGASPGGPQGPAPSGVAAAGQQLALGGDVTVQVPGDWAVTPQVPDRWLLEHRDAAGAVDASLWIHVRQMHDHAEAVRRLAAAENEGTTPVTYELIAGWPAIERRFTAPHPEAGSDEDESAGPIEDSLRTMTAVAVGARAIRLDAMLEPHADAHLADAALAIGRALSAPGADPRQSAADLAILKSGALRPQPRRPGKSTGPSPHGAPRPPAPSTGSAVFQSGARGEAEAAISLDGKHLLIDAACNPSYSIDGGKTWKPSTLPSSPKDLDFDCTVTSGPSGPYFARLGHVVQKTYTGVYVYSTADEGATFSFANDAVAPAGASRPVVDQPHIAADRWNQSANKKDLLYATWHGGAGLHAFVSCSADGGQTWGPPQAAGGSGTDAFPRVFVGRNGSVYVTSVSGNEIYLDRFGRCDQKFVKKATFTMPFVPVACPVAGLDRCNSGNTLSSPTVAVDDINPAHVYLAWAQENSPGNDDIMVIDSTSYGKSFGAAVALNSVSSGQRFMPWIAAWNGDVWGGWYDRRSAVPPYNDGTRYYRGHAFVLNNTLTADPGDVDLMLTDDPACASGFRCNVRSMADFQACGGKQGVPCSVAAATTCGPKSPCPANLTCNSKGACVAASAHLCDFTPKTACPANETCKVNGSSGCPKYGDYTGAAAGGGLLVNLWASGTAPLDRPPVTGHPIEVYSVVTPLPPPAPSGPPPCGGPGEPCCPSGGGCRGSLTCADGACLSMGSTCGQCKQQAEDCVNRCGSNAPNCTCACQWDACSCITENHCGPCEYGTCSGPP